MRGKGKSLAFRIGRGEFTAGASSASDDPASDVARIVMESYPDELAFDGLDKPIRHIGDQEVLPRCQPELAGTVVGCDLGQPPHLARGHYAYGHDDANVIVGFVFLAKNADMPVLERGRPSHAFF